MKQVVIVIPAYNEALVIRDVIRDIQESGFSNIIVADDGSTDATGQVAQQQGAQVIAHRFNRGKGAATKTGIEAAKLMQADIIVTMDADGQHQANDIAKLIKPIIEHRSEVVLGTRQWDKGNIPRQKVMQNMVGNAATWLLHRQWVNDSQSGFRAYSRLAADLINTQADFYDYDSEVIREIRVHRLNFVEVPINVRYTTYSRTKSTRQNITNGIKTAYRMIWHIIS